MTLLPELTAAAQAYSDAERARIDAMNELKKQIIIAKKKGATVTQIARASGLTRQTIYDTLKK